MHVYMTILLYIDIAYFTALWTIELWNTWTQGLEVIKEKSLIVTFQ